MGIALLFAPAFAFFANILGGPLLAIIAVLLVLAWPIATKYSYDANNETFRYYTWIYRTTKPQLGQVEVFTSHTRTGIYRVATVRIGDKEYKCDVVPNTTSPMKISGLAKGPHEMSIHTLPESGEPLCAELGELRIWLEPNFLRSSGV